jgi:molybdopterin synthase catalytic subunit
MYLANRLNIKVSNETLEASSINGLEQNDMTSLVYSSRVKPNSAGKCVERINLEGDKVGCRNVLKKISREVSDLFDATEFIFHLRLGDIPAGDIKYICKIGCRNRIDTFKATEYALEAIKSRLQLRKKEIHTRPSKSSIAKSRAGLCKNIAGLYA